MERNGHAAAALALLATLSVAGTAFSPAPAAGAAQAPSGVVAALDRAVAIAADDASAAVAYWTDARLAGARSLDTVTATATSVGRHEAAPGPGITTEPPGPGITAEPPGGTNDPQGPAVYVAPSRPDGTRIATSATTAAGSGWWYVARPYVRPPSRTLGKLFFSDDGQNYQCSATVVTSANRSLVWTAGHCVVDEFSHEYVHNVVFIPGYGSRWNGDRPYGTWPARYLQTTDAWRRDANVHLDVAAVLVGRVGGATIQQRLGAQGVAFNTPPRQAYRAMGYPVFAPFNGKVQVACGSSLTGRDLVWGAGPNPMRIACRMTEGASGGPWLTNVTAEGYGFVASVNSYKYPDSPSTLFGPYQGNAALILYNAVQSRKVP